MSGLAGQSIGLDEQSPTPIGGPAALDAESKGSMENFIGFGAGATSYDPAPVDFDAADDTVTSAADGVTRVAPEYTDNQLTWSGAGPVFNPIDLFASGEQGAWYDPSDLTTLFQDSAGTIPVTVDGQPVGLILDKSGNNNHAFQSTDVKRPLYKTAGGLHWLQFNGVDNSLVVSAIDFSSTSKILSISGVQKNGTSNGMISCLGTFISQIGTFAMYNNVLDPQLGVNSGGTFVLSSYGMPTYGNGEKFVYGGQFDVGTTVPSSQVKSFVDNSEYKYTTTQGVPTVTGNFGAYPLTIGAFSDGSIAFDGNLYSLIICGKMVSDSDRDMTSLWIDEKLGGGIFVAHSACCSVGDSIAVPILPLVSTTKTKYTVAQVGVTTQQQITRYSDTFYENGDLAWTMVLCGHNDFPTNTTAQMIAGLQELVNDVKRYSATGTKIALCKMTPMKQGLIDTFGATLGEQYYQTWLDVNIAITGGGATPITGADVVITSHEATLNDGNGNLKVMYDDGTHIHPNDAGDLVIANAVVAGLQSIGVTP